jgi:uncharacterized protein YbjT (DUF2867 family)
VRPTGFFSALSALLDMAKQGPLPSLGAGEAKSNPIDDEELAALCVDAVLGEATEVLAGGPEVLTRNQMSEAAFAAVGKAPAFRKLPSGVAKFMGAVLTPFHPRMGQLTLFLASLAENDAVAPKVGKKTLGEYFRQKVEREAKG